MGWGEKSEVASPESGGTWVKAAIQERIRGLGGGKNPVIWTCDRGFLPDTIEDCV